MTWRPARPLGHGWRKRKKWPAWTYDPRPRDFPPYQDPLRGRLGKLRALVIECQQSADGRYHLPGTTFSMRIDPEMEHKLWN